MRCRQYPNEHPMSVRLRELISKVRSSKTIAEERAVVSKECAAIRTAFKTTNNLRHRNVAKCLFCHLLGYPTQFSRMECIKLIASNKFHEKRIGYLGLMMLVDERQDILMLLPNSIKGDLQNPSHFIVSLALVTLANMGSVEMVRDLLPEIDRCCAHTHAFIRKKAALAAVRAIRKEPEVAEQFAPRVVALLGERPHGVVVAACALFLQVHAVAPEVLRPFYGELVPTAVRALKSLLLSSYSAQHDVSGITDPFLQVKLLQVLRILGRGNKAHSDLMSEVLAQVATNTDQRKNAGVAVLYECVQTILSIDAEPGLRVLAINLLMRFLSKNDNNTRYVALNLLHSIVSVERATVQRHKRVVVDCLKDPDISIRRRALDLSYALCDTENIRFMTTELIHYLEEADQEFKPDLTRKLCIVCERYAPSKRWQLETIVKVLARAGAYVRDDIPSSLVLLIAQSPALQADAAALLYKVVSESPLATPSVEEDERNARRDAEASESMVAAHECLIQVAVWAIGEYADLLTAGPVRVEGEDGECTALDVTTDSLLALFGHLLASPLLSAPTRAYTLTATAKLAGRVQDAAQLQRVRAMLEQFRAHPDAEIQQRACEYLEMLGVSEGTLRAPLVKRMPIPTLTNPLIRAALQDDDGEAEGEGEGEGEGAALDGEEQSVWTSVAPFAPLVALLNGVAAAFNEVRLCAPAGSAPQLANAVATFLGRCVRCFLDTAAPPSPASPPSVSASWGHQAMAMALAEAALPYCARLFASALRVAVPWARDALGLDNLVARVRSACPTDRQDEEPASEEPREREASTEEASPT
eukprot:gnl/Trimastix_PCT/2377.p1 GENE.gnl/Trimastix_PCT/2377~~gnl/Trimastix_PCT/2377.p1  ORF type:complete len:859 (-),score=269.85 gnl/Trimastix_PCT/2377:16-2460(-)